MRTARKKKEAWKEYERQKNELSKRPLSNAQYEEEVKKLAKKLRV